MSEVAQYSIKYRDLLNQADSLQSIGITLASFEGRLNSIANAMDGRDSSMATLKTQLRNAAKSVPLLSNKVISCSAGVSSITAIYLNEEKTIHNNIAQVKSVTAGSMVGNAAVGAVIGTVGLRTGATVVSTKTTKASWWDKATSGIKSGAKAVYNVGIKDVKARVEVYSKAISVIQKELGSGGHLEGAWKAVASTTKFVSGAFLFTVSVATLNPLGIAYGANMLISSGHDLHQISKGNYDKVGDLNILKTFMQKTGEVVGENLGAGIGYIVGGDEGVRTGATIGKSAGSMVGSIAYTVGEIYAVASVGKTVVCAKSGSINNALYVKGSEYTTIKELTKLPEAYKTAEKIIGAVDAIAEDNILGYIIGEVADGLSNTKYGKHGLSTEAIKDIIKGSGSSVDKAGLADEVIKKGFKEIMDHVVKPIPVK